MRQVVVVPQEKTMLTKAVSSVLFAAAWVLERTPGLRGYGSDVYYRARYGRGRYPGGRTFYRGDQAE